MSVLIKWCCVLYLRLIFNRIPYYIFQKTPFKLKEVLNTAFQCLVLLNVNSFHCYVSISFPLYRLFCQHQTKKKMCFEIVCNPLTRHWIEKNEMAHQSKCKFTMKGKKIIEEKKPISPSLIAFYAHVQYIIVVVNGKCGVEYI